jgi:cardiolipin synthase C
LIPHLGRRVRRLPLLVAPLLALLAGCAASPPPRTGLEGAWEATAAAARPAGPTRLESRLADAGAGRPEGESGLLLLSSGEDALLARVMLANLAERSLDLQTYIWEFDVTGRLLLARLLAAADRGVSVRLLLDDLAVHGHEAEWTALDLHPRVEVRAFNPFLRSRRSQLARGLELAVDFARLNRRMHNKVFVADGTHALVGGRNVADEYYALDGRADFRDLDLMTVGPAAAATGVAFETFWRSAWAVPLPALGHARGEGDLLARLRAGPSKEELVGFPYAVDLDAARQERALAGFLPRLTWAPARVLYDPPEKIEAGGGSVPGRELHRLAREAEREIVAEIAYLVMPPAGVELLGELSRRGVELRFLTNSLASNDVVAAHAAYAKGRPALLATGVELHELRPQGSIGELRRMHRSPRSTARLHVKAGVIDGRTLFIGSMNLDGRSLDYNTEIIVVVESPELAARLGEFFAAGREPANAWRVVPRAAREPELAERRAGRKPRWIEGAADGERIWTREPRASFGRRLVSRLLRLLPIEGLL